MIANISKLKNLGIFYDYTAPTSLPKFNRYNLVYGWNGSGKTTLTRLFAALGTGELPNYPTLEYKIITDEGTFKHKQAYAREVRVFNKDYITDNSPSLEDPATETKHIFILGKEDKALSAKIATNKAEKKRLDDLLNFDDKKAGVVSLQTQKGDLLKAKGSLFTAIAKTIASSRGRVFRDYNKRNAEKVYDSLTAKEKLSKSDLNRYQSVIEQKVQPRLEQIKTGDIKKGGGALTTDKVLAKTLTTANTLLGKTIKQKAIERLKNNADIAEWVAEGIKLHTHHKSSSCEYCGQALPATRLSELAEHFNQAQKDLVEELEVQIMTLREIYQAIGEAKVTDKSNLYDHLQEGYGKDSAVLEQEKQKILEAITALGVCLKDKKVKTHVALKPFANIDTAAFNSTLDRLNAVIDEHNKLTDDFETATAEAKNKLEKHYISTVYDEAKQYERDLASTEKDILDTTEKVTELANQIDADEATLRDTKVACGKLNEMLKQFLGRDEIVFIDSENGYLIKRNGAPATGLSEGEKTAIAFVHFIISLESDGFNIKEGVVVIDDPISSLDIDAVFRVCALIKAKVENAHQLFLLTHNYEFFNQVKSWFDYDPKINARDKDPAKVMGSFFMVKNPIDTANERRIATLDQLDSLLRDHESEYHYLFKKLAEYKESLTKIGSQGTIEAVYPYPIMARKVIECFLSFRVPIRGSLYVRMRGMRDFNKTGITYEEIEEVYNFINSNSHLDTKTGLIQFDPKLAKNGERCIQMTLDLIKKCDKDHFDAMIKECSI